MDFTTRNGDMGGKLKSELENRGLTQRIVASRMDMAESHISMLMQGKRRWRKRTIRAFAIATGIPMERIADLLGEAYERECSDLIAERDALARGVA